MCAGDANELTLSLHFDANLVCFGNLQTTYELGQIGQQIDKQRVTFVRAKVSCPETGPGQIGRQQGRRPNFLPFYSCRSSAESQGIFFQFMLRFKLRSNRLQPPPPQPKTSIGVVLGRDVNYEETSLQLWAGTLGDDASTTMSYNKTLNFT